MDLSKIKNKTEEEIHAEANRWREFYVTRIVDRAIKEFADMPDHVMIDQASDIQVKLEINPGTKYVQNSRKK